jgi:uncharacterized protein
VVHFEIEGRDGKALQAFYGYLFEWDFMPVPDVPAYGLVRRKSNLSGEGVGIGGVVCAVPEQPSTTWRGPSRADGYSGHVTFYVEVPTVIGGGQQMGKFTDPEGHRIGVVTPSPRQRT